MPMTKAKPAKVKLDWSRLLGFDQADSSERSAKRGDLRVTKVGNKPGSKVGAKFGVKSGLKLCVKSEAGF